MSVTPSKNSRGRFVVDDGIVSTLTLASLYLKNKDKYIVLTSSLFEAQKIYESLSRIIDEKEVLFFPADELVRLDALAMSKEMEAERLYTLSKISSLNHFILITNLAAFKRFLPNPTLFHSQIVHLKVHEPYDLNEIKTKLVKAGYSRVNKVEQSLEFASRGDILDIFPIDQDKPVRLDFFDDELDDIRHFDVASQTSSEHLNKIDILPASSFLLTDEENDLIEEKIKVVLEKDLSIINPVYKDSLIEKVHEDIEKLKSDSKPLNLYRYMSFLQNEHFTLASWLKEGSLILLKPNQIELSNDELEKESQRYLDELKDEGRCISHLSLYQSYEKSLAELKIKDRLYTFKENEEDFVSPLLSLHGLLYHGDDHMAIISYYLSQGYKVSLCLDNKAQEELIKKDLEENNISYQISDEVIEEGVNINHYSIDEGFSIESKKIIFLSPEELFHIRSRNKRFTSKFKEGKILQSFEDLKPGDYVVHELYGIGQFLDITTLKTPKGHKDFIHIQYRGDDVLYVPLEKFKLVRKYVGKEGYVPKLNSLNMKDWEKTKNRIKKRISDIAEKLMAIYETRAKIPGYAFKPDDEFMEQFAAKFPFTLTIDQEKSLEEIKEDMEKPNPMDRLLCGDVGFGKTEVAFRAAFKAILDHKQVVFMCPTTLLAKQHFEVAKLRFLNFGVRMCCISRMTSKKEMTKYLKDIEDGEMHLIIGTHRLLSKEIKYHDLGLLIVDEEQRFGVAQKEQIKAMHANVDVLTLSATPIPRTLQMSLVKLRSLSQITSAPQERSPIQTYVIPYDVRTIKEIIDRELSRGGQVYYIHNDIASIYGVAQRLDNLLRNKKVGVIHAKMDKNEIESVMNDFYSGQIDVLVATSIVENGIDVSNANTIIIDESDHFGLADLYQLKGRVGRGARIAYAYLLYKPHKNMTESAGKRLKAIQEFTELGSGYKIAERDLLIRGAGDILGAEQAGFIDSVGIDLFVKLLEEAVNEKQNNILETNKENEDEIEVDDAYIPESYAIKPDKLEIYQFIDEAKSELELEETKKKIADIYGRIPEEVELLIKKREVSILAKDESIKRMKDLSKYVDIYLNPNFYKIEGAGYLIFKKITEFDKMKAVTPTFVNREVMLRIDKSVESWLDILIKSLKTVADIYKENKGDFTL